MNLNEACQEVLGRDLRAALADILGYQILTPAQEQAVAVLGREPRVAAMGGSASGKTFIFGAVATIALTISPGGRALFAAPKLEQAEKLTWLEVCRCIQFARERGFELAPFGLGIREWYPAGKEKRPDWWGMCYALSDRNNAASVKGLLHSQTRTLIVLDELEGIAPEVRETFEASAITGRPTSHIWCSFNPISRANASASFYFSLPEHCRLRFSTLEAAEWMEKNGISIPGIPTLKELTGKWQGREQDPMYHTYVLGEFPPESEEWTVIPENVFQQCVGISVSGNLTALGIDTAAGSNETVIASVKNNVVSIPYASRAHHGTQEVCVRVKDILREFPAGTPVVVDYIGLGGKGVVDILRLDGVNVLPFIGGAKDFCGHTDPTKLTANVATWAWWEVRELAMKKAISFPDDPVLRRQFARRFSVTADRVYQLEMKEKLETSPDRADAVAMAVLGATVKSRAGTLEWGVL
ncbi:hypothetical protein [Thermogutta sp.]|uniref:hypothetical protein n=1 Tax=Thermogutta sp. TaxID=1962930 RepID=UPI00321FC1D2